MRGSFQFVLLSFVVVSQIANANSFLDKCFPKLDFSKSKIECVLAQTNGSLKFTLAGGTSLAVSGDSKFGDITKNFKIEKISHLQPRLTDAGPMDESIKFLGKSFMGSYTASIDFACDQTAFALVGFDKTDDKQLPKEHAASCQVQSLK